MENGFFNKDLQIKSKMIYFCPFCGYQRISEDEIKKHYKLEMDWQDRWRESKPNIIKLVNPDGIIYNVLFVRRISNGYSGKKCGTMLTIHVSQIKESTDNDLFTDDEMHLNANDFFDVAFPATQQEYDTYISLSEEEKKRLWDIEFDRQEMAVWDRIASNVSNSKGKMAAFGKMIFGTESYDDPWDEFEN